MLEIKAHEDNRQKEAMRARQIGEMLGIEEAHMLEFQQFNASWDAKMSEYEQKSEGCVLKKLSGCGEIILFISNDGLFCVAMLLFRQVDECNERKTRERI